MCLCFQTGTNVVYVFQNVGFNDLKKNYMIVINLHIHNMAANAQNGRRQRLLSDINSIVDKRRLFYTIIVYKWKGKYFLSSVL